MDAPAYTPDDTLRTRLEQLATRRGATVAEVIDELVRERLDDIQETPPSAPGASNPAGDEAPLTPRSALTSEEIRAFLNGCGDYDFGDGPEEKRRFQRTTINLPAQVLVSDADGREQVCEVLIEDISLGGLNILTDSKDQCQLLTRGEPVLARFTLSLDGAPMTFQCLPCRLEREGAGFRVGMRFISGSFQDYQDLAESIV